MTDFLDYCGMIGVRLAVDGERLLVTPAKALRPGDAEFIRANKPAIMAELAKALPACPGVCPGAENALCCGCPSPSVELLFATGEVCPQWCIDKPDARATHWRARGAAEWVKVQA